MISTISLRSMIEYSERIPHPTTTGWIVCGCMTVMIVTGLVANNNMLLLCGCLVVGVWATSWLLAAVNLSGLDVRRLSLGNIFAGSTSISRLQLHNPRRMIPARLLRIEDTIEGCGGFVESPASFVAFVAPRSCMQTRQSLRFIRRGEARFSAIRIQSTYPLGLFRVSKSLASSTTAVVFPRLHPMPNRLLDVAQCVSPTETWSPSSAAGYEEFAGLREFRPGDNPKWIHWKSSARGTGCLLVKEYESTGSGRVAIVLETRLTVTDARSRIQFERAISLAASSARMLTSNGFTVDFQIRAEVQTDLTLSHDTILLNRLYRLLALLQPIPERQSPTDIDPPISPIGHPRLMIDPRRLSPGLPREGWWQWV